MGEAADNFSMIGPKSTTAGTKKDKRVRFAPEIKQQPAEVTKKVVSDKKKSGRVTVTSVGNTICFCSPTTHPGSYKCRLHRPKSTKPLIKTIKPRYPRDPVQEKYESLLKPGYNSA